MKVFVSEAVLVVVPLELTGDTATQIYNGTRY